MLFELVTLHLTFAGASSASLAAHRFAAAPEARGNLIGVWRSEIGPYLKILLLRRFLNEQDLLIERQRTRLSADPFFCGDVITRLDIETFAPFPGFEDLNVGAFGPLYEIRSYKARPGGLNRLIPDWVSARAARDQYSKLLLAMYALDGPDRIVHIWPYASMDERQQARAMAGRDCPGWPPPAGFDWIDPGGMESIIAMPTPESLLA